MSTVYLGRDNPIKWQLKIDGATVTDNAITAAELYVPAEAFSNSIAVTYTTAGSELTLEENNTVLKIELGHVETLKAGRYTCRLTLFDGVDVEGLAWSKELISFEDWRL